MLVLSRKESERIQSLLVGEVLDIEDVGVRAEAVAQLIRIAEHLLHLRSHHALMMIYSVLKCKAIYRLKATWALVEQAMPGQLSALDGAMGGGGSNLVQQVMDEFTRDGACFGCDLRMRLIERNGDSQLVPSVLMRTV